MAMIVLVVGVPFQNVEQWSSIAERAHGDYEPKIWVTVSLALCDAEIRVLDRFSIGSNVTNWASNSGADAGEFLEGRFDRHKLEPIEFDFDYGRPCALLTLSTAFPLTSSSSSIALSTSQLNSVSL